MGLLTKIFLPKNLPATDPAYRSAAGKLSGIVGILCNAVLFAGKFIIGTLSGSVSITADAMKSLPTRITPTVTPGLNICPAWRWRL